jgi:tetratricopeptide (TPR) repeat protein
MRRTLPVVLVAVVTAACGGSEPATEPAAAPADPAPAAGVEATSLLGVPLVRITDFPNRDELEANLAAAEAELAANPDSPDALIWVGRRLAYLWRYREALDTFSRGIERFPDDPRFYRHRGHRHITLRNFDAAVADFEKAASLFAGQPDEVEPDGQPNRLNQPRSTLQFNVWYHLGLAYYLKGDFQNARRAYEECMKVSKNDDILVATADWYWMTLMRLEEKAEADKVLDLIRPEMDIIENTSYHRRLLMYKGLETPEALLDTTTADDLTIATQGYGVGNWYYVNGDTAKAREIFERVVAGRSWSAFGFIAAEADLARMR